MTSILDTPLLPAQKKVQESLDIPQRFCLFCRHCVPAVSQITIKAEFALCTSSNLAQVQELEIYYLIDKQPRFKRCFEVRSNGDLCGVSGRWFERKEV